jgi:hypothetical protein
LVVEKIVVWRMMMMTMMMMTMMMIVRTTIKAERAQRRRLLWLRATLGEYSRALWGLKRRQTMSRETGATDCSLVGSWRSQRCVAWYLNYSYANILIHEA